MILTVFTQTVILDSCNSGSGTRKGFEYLLVVSRGIDLPDNYAILPTLDDDLFPKDIPRATAIAAGYEKSGLASHVLLAGCRATQTSKEDNGRGRFTKALLEILNSDGTDMITYEKLIERLPLLPEQDQQCEGIYKSRILFNSMVPIVGRVLHRVKEKKAGLFELEAGEAYGITVGAKFNVYAIKDPNSRCLSILAAGKTTAFTAELRCIPDTSPFTLNSKAGRSSNMDVYECTRIEMDKNRLVGKRGILLVEKDQSPDIVLTIQDENVVFGITDKSCVDRGLATMPFPVSCDANDVFPVITSAADFH